jgi:hypothetical protein
MIETFLGVKNLVNKNVDKAGKDFLKNVEKFICISEI